MLYTSLECDEIEFVRSHDGLDIYRAKQDICELVKPTESGGRGPLWWKAGSYFTYNGKPPGDVRQGEPYFNQTRRFVAKGQDRQYYEYIQLELIDEEALQKISAMQTELEQQYYEEVL